MEKEKKKRSVLSCVLEWAGQKKSLYVWSILLAIVSVVTKVMPYLLLGSILKNLIGGAREPASYVTDVILIILLFLISELCHTISTSLAGNPWLQLPRMLRRK
jgi:ATP-binding cassette subfamily B protein IrtA